MNRYLIIQLIFFFWDEIKIPIQYGSDYDKAGEIALRAGIEVAGDLTIKSKQKWISLQNQYRLEDAKTAPMITLVVNDNWAEYTLRYVVGYKKKKNYEIRIVY